MECPFIDKRIIPDMFNKPVNYRDCGGKEDYIFYSHKDSLGHVIQVQFCRFCGQKSNVFECLNEAEWKCCKVYLAIRGGA